MDDMKQVFEQHESEVQCYARSFPVVFDRASGDYLYDSEGNQYIDFLAGAGSLNYGHNNPHLKEALIEYIKRDGVTHSLDMYSAAKAGFIDSFQEKILKPRGLDYRMQFPGPTGANAVEAALKLARKVKNRTNIISFTNGFHGVTMGAVAATGNQHHRNGTGVPLGNVTRMPYCGYHGWDVDTLKMLERMLADPSSGVDHPAAVIVEVVQGEGGLNVAVNSWLKGLRDICDRYDMLMIVDDIQAGCGRTGTFFSFESSGVQPDIVTLSKSIGGYGLPLALVLLKPELDIWKPGEHNGTFRGNNHAFVTAKAAIDTYWADDKLEKEIKEKSDLVFEKLKEISFEFGVTLARPKGRGLMQGLNVPSGEVADAICAEAFKRGVILETSGSRGQVVKVFCPLTIDMDTLKEGLEVLEDSAREVLNKEKERIRSAA